MHQLSVSLYSHTQENKGVKSAFDFCNEWGQMNEGGKSVLSTVLSKKQQSRRRARLVIAVHELLLSWSKTKNGQPTCDHKATP